MGTVQVTPKGNSYVQEWVAIQFIHTDGVGPVRKVLKGSPWELFEAVIDGTEASFLLASKGNQAWRINHGDWVVRSPHDKVWFMGHSEFLSQFYVDPES